MSDLTLPDLARKIRDIDFCMLLTKGEGGEIAGRPMSNNRDVEYGGDSWFFAMEDSSAVADIRRDPKVTLALQGSKSLLGAPGIFINIEGAAEVIHDKALMREHWVLDLERWWKDGVDTPGLVLLKVHASLIHYWDGEDEGQLRL